MARQPMVTRTFTTTEAVLLCMDVTTCEPFNVEVTLPRTYKDDECILKECRKQIETDTVKCVHVVNKEIVETLYGMLEQDFIKYATVLPSRNTKTTKEETK